MEARHYKNSRLGGFTRKLPLNTPQKTTDPFAADHWEKGPDRWEQAQWSRDDVGKVPFSLTWKQR